MVRRTRYFSSYPVNTTKITLILDDGSVFVNHETGKEQSSPAWGAWIEILLVNVKLLLSCVAPWMGATCLDAVDAYSYVPEGLSAHIAECVVGMLSRGMPIPAIGPALESQG